jgi:hypothetical protein
MLKFLKPAKNCMYNIEAPGAKNRGGDFSNLLRPFIRRKQLEKKISNCRKL